MRSRYAAYALGNFGQYLIDTWSSHTCPVTDHKQLDIKSTDWCGLDILSYAQKGDRGCVHFKADFSHTGHPKELFEERSYFERTDNQWLYVNGDIIE